VASEEVLRAGLKGAKAESKKLTVVLGIVVTGTVGVIGVTSVVVLQASAIKASEKE
jgi:hypothetical protein